MNRDLSWLHRARGRPGPLSAKADGKPAALSPISNRLREKTSETDLMSRHVPLLRWTRYSGECRGSRLRRVGFRFPLPSAADASHYSGSACSFPLSRVARIRCFTVASGTFTFRHEAAPARLSQTRERRAPRIPARAVEV